MSKHELFDVGCRLIEVGNKLSEMEITSVVNLTDNSQNKASESMVLRN
jgi:hypothetical protein